jgi:hypothetical protein
MVMRVTLALGGAGAASGQACLKRRELRVRVRVGLAAEDAPGVNARVGAVEAEPDAASQRFNIGLGKARVGADRACRGARGALVDARRERGDVGDEWTPMRSEDLFDAHVLSFGWMRFFQTIAAPGQMTIDAGPCRGRDGRGRGMSTAGALPSPPIASGDWASSVASAPVIARVACDAIVGRFASIDDRPQTAGRPSDPTC